MYQDGWAHVAKLFGGLGRGQPEEFAIRGQDGGASVPGDNGRRVGQRDGSAHTGLVERMGVAGQ
jgi:hypothetical protein